MSQSPTQSPTFGQQPFVNHLLFVAVAFGMNFLGTVMNAVYLKVQFPHRHENKDDYLSGVVFYNVVLMPFLTYFSICLGVEACFAGTTTAEGLAVASVLINAFNIIVLAYFLRRVILHAVGQML